MKTVTVFFDRVEVVGGLNIVFNDSRFGCRLPFRMLYDGVEYKGMHVDVTHPYGTGSPDEPLEAGPPEGPFKPPAWDHAQFREICERFYRQVLARVVVVKDQARFTLASGTFRVTEVGFDFEVPEVSTGSW